MVRRAGILAPASHPAAVHSALLKASSLQPAFVPFLDVGCFFPAGAYRDPPAAPRRHPQLPPVCCAEGCSTFEMVVYEGRM